MKKVGFFITSALFVTPMVAFAAGVGLTPIKQLITSIGQILNALIPILIVVAILAFFYGLIQYIRKPEFKEGKNTMIAGIVALFIMVSIWGIVRLVGSAVGIEGGDNAPIQPPAVPQQNL